MEVVAARPEPEVSAALTTSDFVECYLAHYPRVVRALVLSGADRATAEDLAQEAFARSLPKWRRVSRGANPPGYVYTAAFRLLQRHSRRAGRWKLGDVDEISTSPSTAPSTGPSSTEAAATTSVALEAVLAVMPPKRRACAVMCLLVGLSPAEAGEALGIADGTVRKHLEAARQDLQVLRD